VVDLYNSHKTVVYVCDKVIMVTFRMAAEKLD